jgi:hypothetical protein
MVIPDTRGTTTTISNVKVLENVFHFFGFWPGYRRFSPLCVGEFAPGNCFLFLYSVQIRDQKKKLWRDGRFQCGQIVGIKMWGIIQVALFNNYCYY